MFLGEPIKIWVALFVGALIAAEMSGRTALLGQIQMGSVSFGVGYLTYADAAEWANRSEVFAALVVTAVAYRLFLIVMGVIADKDLIAEIIRAKWGAK